MSLLPDRNAVRGNERKTVEHDSFTVYMSMLRNVPSNLAIQLAVDFVKVSPYVFFCSGSLGIWTVENMPLGTTAFHEFVWLS